MLWRLQGCRATAPSIGKREENEGLPKQVSQKSREDRELMEFIGVVNTSGDIVSAIFGLLSLSYTHELVHHCIIPQASCIITKLHYPFDSHVIHI